MNRSDRSTTTRNAHGAAFIELVIVLPVVLVLIIGGIELSNALRTYTRLTGIARELAFAEFRTCSGRLDHAACLQGVVVAIEGHASVTIPAVRIIGSRWQYDPGTSSCQQLASVPAGVAFSAPHTASNSSQIPAGDPAFLTVCQEQRTLFAAEVAVLHRPLLPSIASRIGFAGGIYRASLLL